MYMEGWWRSKSPNAKMYVGVKEDVRSTRGGGDQTEATQGEMEERKLKCREGESVRDRLQEGLVDGSVNRFRMG